MVAKTMDICCWAIHTIWGNNSYSFTSLHHFCCKADKQSFQGINLKHREEMAQGRLKSLLPTSTAPVGQGPVSTRVSLPEPVRALGQPSAGQVRAPFSWSASPGHRERLQVPELGGNHGTVGGVNLYFHIRKRGSYFYFLIVFLWWLIGCR